MSLLYPQNGIEGYSREQFLADLVSEAETEIRDCLQKGAFTVQIDFTEARLSVKLDPSGQLLRNFIDLNNRVLDRFSPDDRRRIGVHTCPGGDQDSTHSADADYADLLPDLFNLHAGRFYIQLASEPNRPRVLGIIREHARAAVPQRVRAITSAATINRLGALQAGWATPMSRWREQSARLGCGSSPRRPS